MGLSVYIRQAVENGKVIFPGDPNIYGFCLDCTQHGKKLKCLECLKGAKSAFGFASQYMNDPIDEEAVEIKSAWIREFDFTPDTQRVLNRSVAYLTVDPAFTLSKTNDACGLVVTKVGEDDLIYVLEAIGKRLDTSRLIDEIFKLVETYDIKKVGIETQSTQITLLHPIKQEMAKRHKFFILDELKTSTRETKAARIRGLIPYYANGRVVHRRGLTELKDQLIQFPRNVHDDIIDALAHQIPHWKTHKGGKVPTKSAPYMSLDWFLEKDKKPKNRIEALFSDFKRKAR